MNKDKLIRLASVHKAREYQTVLIDRGMEFFIGFKLKSDDRLSARYVKVSLENNFRYTEWFLEDDDDYYLPNDMLIKRKIEGQLYKLPVGVRKRLV